MRKSEFWEFKNRRIDCDFSIRIKIARKQEMIFFGLNQIRGAEIPPQNAKQSRRKNRIGKGTAYQQPCKQLLRQPM